MDTGRTSTGGRVFKAVAAVAAIALGAAYTAGAVLGWIDPENRIDAVNLAVIALSAFTTLLLVSPDALARLRNLEVGSFKLEMEAVKQKQAEQADELDDLRLVLTLLLPPKERKHLTNLAQGTTAGYEGHSVLRGELRRLRSIGLIEMHDGRTVSGIPEAMLDLAEYVRLTEFGRRTLARVQAIEDPGHA